VVVSNHDVCGRPGALPPRSSKQSCQAMHLRVVCLETEQTSRQLSTNNLEKFLNSNRRRETAAWCVRPTFHTLICLGLKHGELQAKGNR
jgi:hypothetical protein